MRNPSNGFWRVTSPTDAQITLMREICRVLEKREPVMTRGKP